MRIPKLLTLALFTVVLAVSNPVYGLSSVEQQQTVPLFQSSCGNGVCDPGENTDNCPSDCSVFIGGYCGDGTCDSGEEGSCPQDCGVSCIGQTCIEGYFFDWESCTCVPSEDSCSPQTCSPGEYFDQSLCQCVASSFCGDGSCGSGEDSINCAQDCPPPSTSLCGDNYCNANSEDYRSCPADCPSPATSNCGDGLCDLATEDSTSCPKDCASRSCGNGTCDSMQGESSANCPTDCTKVESYTCGNGVCETSLLEDHANCPSDCMPTCGNGLCDFYEVEEDSGAEDSGIFNKPLPTLKQETRQTCPSDCISYCGNGQCEVGIGEDRINCSADCISQCGNLICENLSGEKYTNCPQDCFCGDRLCDSKKAENITNCPEDCAFCGNGACEPNENSAICFADCEPSKCKNYSGPGSNIGYKPLDCPAECGNGFCDTLYGETYTNCPIDCKTVCGDFRCDLDAGESNPTCPADCVPTCGDGVCDYSKETVVLCPADCPLTALNCGDAKCEPGEAVACPECWGRFDHRCEFGEGSYFRSPDCYTVYPGCSCYEMIANHQGLAGIYGNPATIYRNPGYSIPVEPLIWVSIAFFMRGRRIKQNDPRT